MQTRTVVLIGALSLAAGWLSGTSSTSQAPPAPAGGAGTARRGPRPLGAGPAEPRAPFTEQLRSKMQDVPRSPTPGRNPFSFGARHAAPQAFRTARAPEAVGAADAPPGAAPIIAERPRFVLSGIAARERDGKSTLTAILMDNGALVFATTGEKLAGGYVVVRIGESSVVIADPSGAEQTIVFK